MSSKIKINSVTGGNTKDDLKNCYFLPSTRVSNAYDFYDTNNNSLATGITGTSFTFVLDGHNWEIENLVISDTAASGDWSNDASITEGEDGTFQAQAGSGVDENVASANA